MSTTTMDLRAAAARLGVHYQTAYQWVRSGDLRAEKRLGAYVVSVADVDRLAAERARPRPAPRAVRVRDWDQQAARFAELIVVGDERAAARLVTRLAPAGVLEVCQRLFTPALRSVGERWAAGAIGVADEHLASGVCERLLARLTPMPAGRHRGSSLVTAAPGEEHHLPAAMASAVLREDHWSVDHLGVSLSADHVLDMVGRRGYDLVVVSVTRPDVARAADRLAKHIRALGASVLVGHPGAPLADLVARARAS